jgi:4-hydroxybenzoate polyprenyltransferase
VIDRNKTSVATKILDCLFLLRVALLAPVWTILIIGWITGTHRTFFFIGNNSSGDPLLLWTAILGFSFIVAFIYVVNQIVDIESDRINHKLFLLPHGYLSKRTAWILAIACALIGLSTAFFFDRIMVILFAASLLLGVFYNLPPLQLKNHSWGGVTANIVGHGFLTFLVGWHASQISEPNLFASLYCGFISSISPGMAIAAVFLATTIPDAEGDRLTQKMTFCIRYGEKKTALASALFCIGSFLSSFLISNNFWIMTIPSAVSLPLFIMLAKNANTKKAFQAFKWPVFILTAFVVFFVPAYGVLILLTFFGSRAYYRWRFGIEYPTFKAK